MKTKREVDTIADTANWRRRARWASAEALVHWQAHRIWPRGVGGGQVNVHTGVQIRARRAHI
jgi:hypothetical protein